MHIIETVFESLLLNSLRASILALGILSIQWFFRHRLTPAWRHALWLPLLASLALPAIPLLPAWSGASFTSAPQQQAPAVPVITAAPAETMGVDVVSEPLSMQAVVDPLLPQTSFEVIAPASETVAPAATESGFALKSLVAIVWVTGAIVLLVTGLLGYHRNMRKIRRCATQPDHQLQTAIAAAAEEAGLASAPLTWVSPVVSSPAVAGITRPVLLLPAAFPGELDASEVRLVLLHEFSHIKRLDLPLNWLSCLFLAAHWCNPLLWFAFARMRIDREKACDARVLAIDAGGRRAQYGETLIKMQISAPSRAWTLGFIGLFERGFEIKSRIRQIAAYRPGTSLSLITGAALLTLLMGLALVKSGQAEAEPIPAAPKPADGKNDSAFHKSEVPDEKKAQAASPDAPGTSTAESNKSRALMKKLILDLYGEGAAQDEPAQRAAAMRLRQLLVEMNEVELMAAYQEINDLPLSPKNRWELEDVMLYYIESKNPEFAFSQHIARFEKNDQLTEGIGRFHLWLHRNPAAATAWYEGEVAKGTFDKTLDGKSSLRLPFEAAFVRSLLASDPAAAESKMNAISPEQRKELFATYFKYPQGDPKPLVDLIRKTMPKEEQAELILTQVHVLLDTNKVLERLAIVNATQEERSLLLQKIGSKYLNSDKLDNALLKQYRDWSMAVDPSSADRSAGLAFAQYTEKRQTPQDYEYLTKLAIDFHGLGAGDDFIIGLVEGKTAGRTPLPLENARALAMKIADQTRRNQILEKLQ